MASALIDLTPREFAILECLMDNAGKAVSRMTLMRDVWNIPFDPTTNIVDVYMKYLRDKIDIEGEVKLLRTVRGIGYVLRNDCHTEIQRIIVRIGNTLLQLVPRHPCRRTAARRASGQPKQGSYRPDEHRRAPEAYR